MEVNKNITNKKNSTIDIVKGIAIILVVFGHLLQYSIKPSGADFFENLVFKIIYSFHMPLFIFVSGYLLAFSLKRRNIYDTFKSRIRSLIVPYVAWVLIDIIVYLLKIIIENQQLSIIELIKLPIRMLIISPNIWFLFTLFALSCVLLISIKLEKWIGKISYVVIFLLVVIFPSSSRCDIYFIKWFYLFFMVGYFANRFNIARMSIIQSKLLKNIMFSVALVLFIFLISIWTRNDYIYNNRMKFISSNYFNEIIRLAYRYIMAFLGIGIIFYVADFLTKTKLQNTFKSIGFYSIDIFLLQRYIVETGYYTFVKHNYIKFDYNSSLFILVYIPILTIVGLGICIIISKYILRKRKLLNKLLLGNRVKSLF